MQALCCDEFEHFRVFRDFCRRKSMKKIEGFFAVREIPAGKFFDYEGMDENSSLIQEVD